MTELNSPKDMIFQLIHEYGGEERKEMFDYITDLVKAYDDLYKKHKKLQAKFIKEKRIK